jgi:hypothetical protein
MEALGASVFGFGVGKVITSLCDDIARGSRLILYISLLQS